MLVLLLGPNRPSIQKFIERCGDTVKTFEAPLTPCCKILVSADFIVSYGYRHLLPQGILQTLPGKAINLHISMLPWNRGADPNLWSFLEDTPKGISIHLIDRGTDTGPILFQEQVHFDESETLKTTYEKLSARIESLFLSKWSCIRDGNAPITPQKGMGSFHKASDKLAYEHLLYDGWNTPVKSLVGKAL